MYKFDPVALAAQFEGKKLPPLARWHPPLSGELDMRIARDGAWYHEGTPIQRQNLARLFSTILRREDDGCYYTLHGQRLNFFEGLKVERQQRTERLFVRRLGSC